MVTVPVGFVQPAFLCPVLFRYKLVPAFKLSTWHVGNVLQRYCNFVIMSKAGIRILNKSEDEATIEIFGDIGEGWFGEGNTMKSVNDQIKGLDVGNIIVDVGSLGGSVVDGLGIYAVLRSHPAHITARIMSPTASAGTVVALGADKVTMSEAAMFLVHNTWTYAAGNAEEMRETAEDLDKFDERLVDIYQKKTGKRKSQIRKLMSEERWLDPKEAKELGYIDETFDSETKVAASIITHIQGDKGLPKLPSQYISKFSQKEEKAPVMETSRIEKLLNKIEEKFQPVFDSIKGKENEETLKTQIEAAKAEAIAEVEKLREKEEETVDVNDVLENIKKEANEDIEAEKKTEKETTELDAMKAELKKSQDEVARLKGEETTIENKEDIEANEKIMASEAGALWDALATEVNSDIRARKKAA